MLFRLYRDGFLKAFSIGFRILKDSMDKLFPEQQRRTILEWDMMEYSAVGIPANPDALMRMAKSCGLPEGATETDLLKAVGKLPVQKYWDTALPIFVKRNPVLPEEPLADLPVRKSILGYAENGYTSAVQGATSPVHVHDYYLHLQYEGDSVSVRGGWACGVADHTHRITLESLVRGETEPSDGHIHKLMKSEAVQEALAELANLKTVKAPKVKPKDSVDPTYDGETPVCPEGYTYDAESESCVKNAEAPIAKTEEFDLEKLLATVRAGVDAAVTNGHPA
jgi:hypothetical protein